MSPTPQRGVKLGLLLTDVGGAFISDDFGVQFRPENYFGTTAVDLTAGSSGVRVGDNETYVRTSAPDRSMSQMLTTGSIAVDGTLTTQMISSLDKVIKYANGLTPLVQSGIVIADSVAATQRNLPSELLAKANDVMAAFPAFNLGAMSGLYSIFDSVYMKHGADGSLTPDEDYFTYMEDGLKVAGTNLFGQAGALLKSHSTELPALTQVLTYLLEPVPSMVGGPQTMDQILTAIDQSKSAFTGPPGQQTLRIRLALNSLPRWPGRWRSPDGAAAVHPLLRHLRTRRGTDEQVAFTSLGPGLKLGALLAVTIAFFVLVVNAMRNPVDGAADTYTAEFTDVSGLHVNGDVRNLGMRIGKVQSIELHTGPRGRLRRSGSPWTRTSHSRRRRNWRSSTRVSPVSDISMYRRARGG